MIEAAFIYDEAHLFTALARTRRQARGRLVFNGVKIVCALILAVMAGLLLWERHILPGLILLVPLPILALGHRLEQPSIRRRFLKSPFRDAPVRFRFSEELVEVNDGKVDARIQWTLFTRLVLFDDGLLVFQGEGVFNWIPVSAFTSSADYEAVVALFCQKIARQRDLRRHEVSQA